MRIGIKVGSSLLTTVGNGLSNEAILRICQQIADLLTPGHQVFLVTSGAVASDPKRNRQKNLRAAVGMGRLISRYIQYFDIFGVEAGQMLLTDRDLHSDCRDSLIRLFNEAMNGRIVPIVNANDTVDWQELEQLAICADNDVLFMNLCLALKPDYAIIGFDQAGALNANRERVAVVNDNNFAKLLESVEGSSASGHGEYGMLTKIQTARYLAQAGIKTLIAGRCDDFISRAVAELSNPQYGFGTHFRFGQREFDFTAGEPHIKTLVELRSEHGIFA